MHHENMVLSRSRKAFIQPPISARKWYSLLVSQCQKFSLWTTWMHANLFIWPCFINTATKCVPQCFKLHVSNLELIHKKSQISSQKRLDNAHNEEKNNEYTRHQSDQLPTWTPRLRCYQNEETWIQQPTDSVTRRNKIINKRLCGRFRVILNRMNIIPINWR